MTMDVFQITAWLMAVCSGLMTGVYLAFSLVIMKALGSLSVSQGIAAMNAINTVILKTAFMPLFFGSSVIAVVMIAASLWYPDHSAAGASLAAGLVYLFGMFISTAAFNVPLNNRLAAVQGDSEVAQEVWLEFQRRWTRWNTSRTIWSLVTLVISLDIVMS